MTTVTASLLVRETLLATPSKVVAGMVVRETLTAVPVPARVGLLVREVLYKEGPPPVIVSILAIPSTASTGLPTLTKKAAPLAFVGISPGSAVGTPSIQKRPAFVSIPPSSAVGKPVLAAAASTSHIFVGIPSHVAVGVPLIRLAVTPISATLSGSGSLRGILSTSAKSVVPTTPIVLDQYSSYRVAQTRVGDTLRTIAQREMGDAARWYDLVRLNNLAPPYITDDPFQVMAGVLRAGADGILIPSSVVQSTGVSDRSVFGADVALVDGQIGISQSGDVLTVSGVENVKQAIRRRILVRPAELVYHPKYGCRVYDLLGEAGTPDNTQLAAAFVGAAIKADPRIANTLNVVALVAGDVLSVTATAITVDGKILTVGV